MSTSLSQIKNFTPIVALDVKAHNFATHEDAPRVRLKIDEAASAVIAHLQTTFNPEDTKLLAPFIEKIKLINQQFETAGKGTVFATSIQALDLIYRQRTTLPPSIEAIARDPFILELKALAEAPIEDKLAAAQKLYKFQNVLIPALQSVQSLQELLVLQSLVDDCNALTDKLQSVDKRGALKELRSKMLKIWNAQSCKTNPVYAYLVSYESHPLQGLENSEKRNRLVEKLTPFIDSFANVVDDPAIPLQDKIAIYNALRIIRGQFETLGREGERIDTFLQKLNKALGIPAGIDSSFPLELENLIVTETSADKAAAVKKLSAFQTECLLPAMAKASTREELLAFEELVNKCKALKDKLVSVDKTQELERLNSNMFLLWKAKIVQTDGFYTTLVNYQKGQVGNLENTEIRADLAKKIKVYVDELVKVAGQLPAEDKIAIHRSLCTIYEEFSAKGAENLIEPSLRAICTATHLPFPERKSARPVKTAQSKAFSELRSNFEHNGSSGAVSNAHTVTVRAKTERSPEEIRDAAEKRILENIAKLDLASPRLRENIQEIKNDIQKLKNLAIMKGVDFSGLEEALNIITDPSSMNISQEEGKFIQRLLLKYGNSIDDLKKYANAEANSVRNARGALLRALKNANSLKSLIQAAPGAKEAARDQAIKERFDRFVEIHPFPALSHNFATLFPTLIRNFEAFTREVVSPELENKWNQVRAVYDAQSSGKFSKLVEHYSYMDPKKNFEYLIRLSQNAFFEKLNLEAIDTTSKANLVPYLQQVMNSVKDVPGNVFKSDYKKFFSKKHKWLLRNVENIMLPYNQADDDSKNIGDGVCYNNSLYRFTQIQADPKISPDKIQMGSNEKTRYFQNKVSAYYDQVDKKAITLEQAADQQTSISVHYGLEQYHKYTLQTPPSTDPHEYLLNEMTRFAQAGHSQFILCLYGKGGHAVNIQIDIANGMYRLCDDNLGVGQYKTLQEFKKEISQYFKTFYPKKIFQFRLFKKI